MTRGALLFVGNFLSHSGTHRHYSEDLSDRLERRDWRITRTSTQPGRLRRLADMLAVAWTSRHRYELAHLDVFSGPAFVWAEAVAFELRRLGRPFILTLRGGRLPEFARAWPRRVSRLLASASAVVVPSPYLRDAIAPGAVLIPNAIDLASYNRTDAAVHDKLVWVRAFHAIYNPTLAVETLARLRPHHPKLELLMVGADKGDGTLAATHLRAQELGLADVVTIVPGVPKAQVPDYLAAGSVFLNTADIDNTPVSVIEAMASGLCVVSTNVGGMPQLVRDGHDALLVPPRDSVRMADAVARVLDDRALATRLRASARSRMAEFDWSRVLESWERLFTQVLHAA